MAGKQCPYWHEYQSSDGWVCFCEVTAYEKRLTPSELAAVGCTPERRLECHRAMQLNLGFASTPAPLPGLPDQAVLESVRIRAEGRHVHAAGLP